MADRTDESDRLNREMILTVRSLAQIPRLIGLIGGSISPITLDQQINQLDRAWLEKDDGNRKVIKFN